MYYQYVIQEGIDRDGAYREDQIWKACDLSPGLGQWDEGVVIREIQSVPSVVRVEKD